FETASRLWQGRGTTPFQASRTLQPSRRKQMARRALWYWPERSANWTHTNLSRHVRLRTVSMSVSTGIGSLGDGAHNARMEHCGNGYKRRGISLACLMDRGGIDARAVAG